jgi:hypothetical protein
VTQRNLSTGGAKSAGPYRRGGFRAVGQHTQNLRAERPVGPLSLFRPQINTFSALALKGLGRAWEYFIGLHTNCQWYVSFSTSCGTNENAMGKEIVSLLALIQLLGEVLGSGMVVPH